MGELPQLMPRAEEDVGLSSANSACRLQVPCESTLLFMTARAVIPNGILVGGSDARATPRPQVRPMPHQRNKLEGQLIGMFFSGSWKNPGFMEGDLWTVPGASDVR